MTLYDAVALVSCSAVGGGFLAIAEVTFPLGFLPSTAGLIVTWFFLVMAGLAYVEAAGAASGEGRGASILALTRYAFGAKRAAVVSFIFLLQDSPRPRPRPRPRPSPQRPGPAPAPAPASASASVTVSRLAHPSPRSSIASLIHRLVISLAQMFAVSAANLIKAAQLAGICWAMPNPKPNP